MVVQTMRHVAKAMLFETVALLTHSGRLHCKHFRAIALRTSGLGEIIALAHLWWCKDVNMCKCAFASIATVAVSAEEVADATAVFRKSLTKLLGISG